MNAMDTLPDVIPKSILDQAAAVDMRYNSATEGSIAYLEHFSILVMFNSLRCMPSLVRRWYEEEIKRHSTPKFVELVNKYMSPLLIRLSLEAVQADRRQHENMVVRTRPVVGEVVAIYTLDTMVMELVVTLPNGYPLKNIDITCGKRLGVPEAQWRKWLLQMRTIISAQVCSMYIYVCY